MPEKTIKLTGLNAIIACVILLSVLVMRVTSIGQNADEALLSALKVQLVSEFYPNQVARLKAALNQTDLSDIEEETSSIIKAKIEISAVTTSYPVMDFSFPKNVIVKVTYNLDDGAGDKIIFYRFKEVILGSKWLYQSESNVLSFYLNFL
mgnify:CR=1 FL=1